MLRRMVADPERFSSLPLGVRVSERLYGLLLHGYPAEFRAEYGAQLRQVFSESCRAAYDDKGWQGMMRFWSETLGDLGTTVLAEHLGILWQDLRYGVRMLLRSPGFTAVVVLTLALGIGATTAIFSVVNAVLLRPLPFLESERLLQVWMGKSGGERGPFSAMDFLDFKNQNQVFERIALYEQRAFSLKSGAESSRMRSLAVSADFFDVLKVRAALGRTFLPEEEKSGRNQVVMLSYPLWESRFGANPAWIGRNVRIDAKSYTIVGVMPRDFRFGQKPIQLFVPFAFDTPASKERGNHGQLVIARLKPGVVTSQAQVQVLAIAQRLSKIYPDTNGSWAASAFVVPLYDEMVGKTRPALLVLMAAVATVLLIACANVANLLLVRAAARSREIAIRTALGASRSRLVRQLLTESVLLALVGAAGGLGLAWAGVGLLVNFGPNLPRLAEATVDLPVLGFGLVVALLAGIGFGLVPALQASRIDLNVDLKDGGRGATGGREGRRLRNGLVVGEVALALVLLTCAGLLLQSFARLQGINPGFDPRHLLVTSIDLAEGRYTNSLQQMTFLDRLLERVRVLPGVEAVAGVSTLPLYGSDSSSSFFIEGRAVSARGQDPVAGGLSVSADYFRAMGIPILRGRAFSERDRASAPQVMAINEEMARQYFPNENPIGKRLTLDESHARDWWTIVGIVGNVRHTGLADKIRPEMFFPFAQKPAPGFVLVVRAPDPTSLSAPLRTQVSAIDGDQALGTQRTMEQVVAETIGQERFNMLLLAGFAALALVLAAVGIYGVMSYSVSQRTQELGIRMALGAQPSQILALVIRQGMVLVLAGIGLGMVGAVAGTRVLKSLLFNVSATDPLTFVVVAGLLTLVAFLACYLPARRATRVDPMVALRSE